MNELHTWHIEPALLGWHWQTRATLVFAPGAGGGTRPHGLTDTRVHRHSTARQAGCSDVLLFSFPRTAGGPAGAEDPATATWGGGRWGGYRRRYGSVGRSYGPHHTPSARPHRPAPPAGPPRSSAAPRVARRRQSPPPNNAGSWLDWSDSHACGMPRPTTVRHHFYLHTILLCESFFFSLSLLSTFDRCIDRKIF